MQQLCTNPWCHSPFEITDFDLQLLAKVSPVIGGKRFELPSPTLCPDCRQQRRLTHRNERVFYHRRCAKTGKDVISIYAPDSPCTVFDQTVWWGDDWDQLSSGRPFDANRTFFEQFHELSLVAPRPCIMNMGSENSLYTHHAPYNKNCYMCLNSGYNQDCFHITNFSIHNVDCADCLGIQHCERCAECVDCKRCIFSSHLQECEDCESCHCSYDCQSCSHCIGCFNLRRKQYCIHNEQLSKEEYDDRVRSLSLHRWTSLAEASDVLRTALTRDAIHRCTQNRQSEDCSGDRIVQCRDVHNSFFMFDCEECAHCHDCGDTKSSLDAYEPYHGELQYETHGCNLGYSLSVCSKSYECQSCHLSEYCFSCSDCFGCFGLRRKKYCILNKQHSKEDYESTVLEIIDHMRRTGEWGQFFPTTLSPFGYNETVAQEYYPITEAKATKRGWRWKHRNDELPNVDRIIPATKLPDSIDEIPDLSSEASAKEDDIVRWAIECPVSKRPFKIIKQELDFYRTMRLPIPRLHPDERHKRRMALRNPRKLWERQCSSCHKPIATSYSPKRPEKMMCEECYLKMVY